ncbi:pre-rRNA-processing protein TSR2 homolog [Leptinotarsa decemlineata]|uniref:pre-rRNA-processing protein TSR2 homolog n=1 Tax=Leptinotarsa decemlineata TaxID=7539 RepID=UPI000C2521F6|nr:uncharacterized protein LOC111516496 [Leptinotarsa decemlineata]
MEQAFNKVIKHVFSNWTGLKLAVEHSMAGPNSKEVALRCLSQLEDYCLHNSDINEDDIQDFLDDIMDENFNTVFEDDSTRDIGVILCRFLQLLRAGDEAACESEYHKLPAPDFGWLEHTTKHAQVPQVVDNCSSDENNESDSETPMEEDGWTVVKSKKR